MATDWKSLLQRGAYGVAECVALATVNIVSRPGLTIPLFLPLSFIAGRCNLVSSPVAVVGFVSLFGLLYIAVKRKHEDDFSQRSFSKPLDKDDVRGKLESAEWLNAAVQLVWRRYPVLVAEFLRKDIVDEILEGMRRDKVFPAAGGVIKDIIATKIVLRDSSPWIMDIRLNQMRAADELSVTGRVRFVSDQDAGVELSVQCAGGINIPIKIENISVETWLNVRVHMLDRFPFVRVVWISMLERPKLDLAIRPDSRVDVMHIPGVDLLLHDLIMTAIEKEIVFPMGKIVPIDRFMPDEYYFEKGHSASRTDMYAGKVTVHVQEAKCMVHPAYTLGASELCIRLRTSEQRYSTMPITDTLHEKLHERFDFFTSLTDPSEGVCIELVCSSSEGTVTYDAVPLAHVSVDDVVRGKWTAKTWIDVPGLSGGNSKVLVSCFYTPFQRSLRTIDTQHSPGGEFVGGNCDLTAEEIELGNYAYPGKPLSGVQALSGEPRARAAAAAAAVGDEGGGGGEDAGAGADDVRVRSSPAKKGMQRDDSSISHEEVEVGPGVWQRLLPRSMFRGVVWLTVHEGADLQPKMIGTRDPYVKAKVGQQIEKTEAIVDSVNPTFEQELCLFVSDPVNNTVQLSVHQNDVALGRHITDDSIGSYTVSLKQLISDKPEHHGRSGSWSGWVTLENAKRGRIRITLKYEALQDAIQVAKEFGGATCGQGMGLPVSVSHRPPTLYGVLQVLVLGARDLRLDNKKDKTLHPFVGLQLGDHQKYETRTVRGSSSPVFNEYFELLVRDPLKERLEIRVESKDLLMSDKIGLIRLPITQIARGKVLQEWMPISDKSSSQILLEIRLCNFEYESQERTPQTRFDMLLEKAARMEAEAVPFQPAVVKTTDSKEPRAASDVADQVVN